MSREIVILHLSEEFDAATNDIISVLMTNTSCSKIHVASRSPVGNYNMAHEKTACTCMQIPEDCDTEPKVRNWVNKAFKDSGFTGFLHVIKDNTNLLKSPNEFLEQLEAMMTALDYSIWLNTTCDPCNYVFKKYNPRVGVSLDHPDVLGSDLLRKIGPKIFSTSHSNTQWMCYDMKNVKEDLLKFDDQFTIPMYYIIDLLARRKESGSASDLFFMNQYLTVDAEHGTFERLPESKPVEFTKEVMQQEDALFKSKNHNVTPDNNIDMVLERIWEKMMAKLQK